MKVYRHQVFKNGKWCLCGHKDMLTYELAERAIALAQEHDKCWGREYEYRIVSREVSEWEPVDKA